MDFQQGCLARFRDTLNIKWGMSHYISLHECTYHNLLPQKKYLHFDLLKGKTNAEFPSYANNNLCYMLCSLQPR